MRKTTLILLGGLFFVVGGAYYEWTIGFAHVARMVGGSKVPVEVVPGAAGHTPQMMMDEHRARYHLPPDARFVMALAIVSSFPDKVEAPVSPHFQNGSWHLKLAHGEVTLPELPSFDQTLMALRQQARATLERVKLTAGESPEGYTGFEPTALLLELKMANNSAANGISPSLLRRSAAASCRLAYATPDATHTADNLAARCLAMAVLAETATGTSLPEEMSISASIFEFTDNALAYGAELSENHPWRAYLERNDALLESRAADPYAGYLLLRRYATRQMGDSWRKQLQLTQGQMQPHQLMTVYALSEHDVTMQVMLAIPSLLWPMVTDRALPAMSVKKKDEGKEQETKAPAVTAFDLLAELGSESAKASSAMQGPLFSADEYQAVYRAYLYASLYEAAYTALELRNSKQEAESVKAMIATSKAPEAVQFAKWYQDMINAKYGKANLQAMRRDLKEMTAFGSQLIIDMAHKLDEQYEDASAAAQDLLDIYSKSLDSRLGDRQEFARFANKQLVLGVAEDMYGSLAEQAKLRYPRLNAWYYDSRGEMDKVKEIAFDKRLDHINRVNAQDLLANDDGYDPQLADAFEATAQAEPLDWNSRNLLVTYLKSNKKFKEAREVTFAWLKYSASKDNLNSFGYWRGAIELSELELKLGNKEQAWAAVEPLLETNYGPAYSQAIKVALAMGRIDRATEIAHTATERYPDSTPLMSDLLAVAWKGGFYSGAAQALRSWGPASWSIWKKYFAEPFASAFVNKPQEAHQAMDLLLQAGNDRWKLQTFTEAVDSAGNPQLAYELQLKLIENRAQQLPMAIRAYESLKKTVGDDEAVDWLKAQLRGIPDDYIAMGVAEGYDFGLLWSLTKPYQSRYPSTIWLYRAVGYVTGKASSSEQIKELTNYYQSASEDDRYDLFGKYLMGLVPEERIKNLSLDQRGISEAAYYLGLGAARDKRYRDMVDWMRVCLDTRDEQNGEYHYASTLLIRWRDAGGVDTLVRKGALF